MAELVLPQLRVKALQPTRRRAGLEFTSVPSELTLGMLGTGLAAVMALAMILGDPQLLVTVIDGDQERPVSDEERDQLTAFLEAESARVDPEEPPTPDAAATGLAASGDTASDQAPAEPAPGTSSKPPRRKSGT